MPAANAKTIKRRIKSVKNTKKITKAMELVAASKMRRSMNAVLNTRPFAQLAWNTVTSITSLLEEEVRHPLLEENTEAKRSLVLLFTSDRGLAGAFNASILKKTLLRIQSLDEPVDVIAVGRRGNAAMARKNIPVVGSFEGLTNKPVFEDILPIARLVLSEYEKKSYRNVYISYTDFKSALSQVPNWVKLLPLSAPEQELGNAQEGEELPELPSASGYQFEPNAQVVLDRMLPRLVETMIWQALLESAASEHASRMMAMRSATDNAAEMIGDLIMTFNRIRQASITQEISEISAGKSALE